jgi:hypothetical protein
MIFLDLLKKTMFRLTTVFFFLYQFRALTLFINDLFPLFLQFRMSKRDQKIFEAKKDPQPNG